MNPETLHQQLDAWEEGNLSPSEVTALNQWLLAHPDAAQEQENRQLVAELMEFAIAQDLRQEFKNAPVKLLSPIHSLKRIAAVAAITLAVLAAGSLLYTVQGRYDHDEIVADLSKAVAIPNTGSVRGENSLDNNGLQTIILLIEDGQFEQANSLIEDGLKSSPRQPNLVYLKAYAKFRNGQYASALDNFKTIQPGNTFDFGDDLQWNMILCKLNLDYPDETIIADLARIQANPESDHLQKAMELEHQLNSIWYWIANIY